MAKRRRKKRGSGLIAFLGVLAAAIVVVLVLAIYQAAQTGSIFGARTQNTGANAQIQTGTASAADTVDASAADADVSASQDGDIISGTIFDPENGSARAYDRTNNGENWEAAAAAADDGTALAGSGDTNAQNTDGTAAEGTTAGGTEADGTSAVSTAAANTAADSSAAADGTTADGSAAAESTAETSANLIYVVSSNVNIRSGPGTDSDILGQASYGQELTKTGEDGEWTSFDYNGQTAWIKTEFISDTKPAKQEWVLADLDNEAVNFGYNSANRDENNVPTDWLWYESKWGQFDVDWIQDTSKNTIYLTMDEGFGNDNTITILDTLKEKGVNVTFFLTKYFVDERPELVQRMLDEGHQLGNHTCTHPNMPTLSIDGQTEQVMTLHNLVKDQFGYEMSVFRYPEGVYSNQSLGLVNNLGYKAVFWSYAYGDYDENNQPPVDESLEKALNALHNGAIYLLHASSDTNTAFLADFIDGARERGFEFGRYPLD